MTLRDILSKLNTPELKITLYDSNQNVIVVFYSPGYLGIEDTILDSDVEKWLVISDKELKIFVNYLAPEPEPEQNPLPSGTSIP